MKNSYTKLSVFVLLGLFYLGCATAVPFKSVHNFSEETPSSESNLDSEFSEETPTAENQNTNPNIKKTPTLKDEQDPETKKYGYELGFSPDKPLKEEERTQINNRRKLRILERSLDSEKERLQYSKVLPWLTSDQEKIDLLSIPSVEGRQVWINQNKIWSRASNLNKYEDLVDTRNISIGMPQEYVRLSWGEPTSIETSGNAIYKNERWLYIKQVSTSSGYKQERRHVYFEGGKVSGWETE